MTIKPSWEAYYTGQYLTAKDLPPGRSVVVTITDVRGADVEQEDGSVKHRPILTMRGKDKKFLVNRTNGVAIAAMFGDDPTAVVGKRLEIQAVEVRFGRDRVKGVRVIGSPDLDRDVTFELKMPRKKPQTVTLRRTTTGAAKAEQPPAEGVNPGHQLGD